jgi:hypothetical protein
MDSERGKNRVGPQPFTMLRISDEQAGPASSVAQPAVFGRPSSSTMAGDLSNFDVCHAMALAQGGKQYALLPLIQ